MNIGAILIGIALLVGVVAFVARPLFQQRLDERRERTTNTSSRQQLTRRRDATYALIRELDADYQTGKVNDEDYKALREQYVAQGVSVLQQLDALSSQDGRAAVEAEIEAKVLGLRGTQAARESARQRSIKRFCFQCGQPVDPEDRFCAYCGASLKGSASQ